MKTTSRTNYLKCRRPQTSCFRAMCACIERQAQPAKANNNRQCGSVRPRYLKIEMWPALDLHYFFCPTWRRVGASVLLEDSQVMSAPLRPGCALTLAERPMRNRPLG